MPEETKSGVEVRLQKINEDREKANVEEARLKSELEFTLAATIGHLVRVYGNKEPVKKFIDKEMEKASVF